VKDERDPVQILFAAIGGHPREQSRHGLRGHPVGLGPVALVAHVVNVAVLAVEVAAARDFEDIRVDRHPRQLARDGVIHRA
jgi:hypothetical protein